MDQQDQDGTVAGQITRALAERIIAGTLAPGARLRQDHLAAEFRASHVPVREAFRRLEAQGLVVREPRRGVRVAAFDPHSIREVTEMRAALEVLALRHALTQMTDAALAAAEAALTEGEGSDDILVWERANRRFHRAILMPSPRGAVAAYLDHEGVLAALKETKADAVWPGWCFVAEDSTFVDRLTAEGILFLGPSADAMRALRLHLLSEIH